MKLENVAIMHLWNVEGTLHNPQGILWWAKVHDGYV